MNYVYSTLTAGQDYIVWRKVGDNQLIEQRHVTINGGANLPDRFLVTPRGVVTKVSDDDLALLEQNEVFKMHKANGFIVVDSKSRDIEQVTSGGMQSQDDSAPLTPEDYMASGDNSPKPVDSKKK